MKKKYLIKTKYGNFNATIWRDNADDKMYLVEVPSFNKTMTQGMTLADAKYMAQDLIELLCEVAFDDGKVVIDDERHIVARGKLKNLSGVVALAA
ncbi:MAG: type II toxin-antitoxin system HicB family antitoxin [Candidatus Paceibacterota bacterium]